MANRYLDYDGLLYFWQKLKELLSGKVDAETGKGLSTNDYTTTEKSKLAGIASGAEVNQNAFATVKVGSVNISADAKSDTLTVIAGDNITLTPNSTSDSLTIAATDTTYNDATTSAHGLMTAAMVTKLNGVDTGAEVNVIETVKVNGTAQAVTNKAVDIAVPTKTSDITNDSGFITSADIPEGSAASTTTPKMDGTATVGTEMAFARGDHVHPSDTAKANLASPTFTGTPKAPTAAAGTNTTQIATTAFVSTAIANAQTGAAMFQGTVNAPADISGLTDYKKGYYWLVQTAGTYAGEACEAGDMIFAIADYSSSYKAADFTVVQNNLDVRAITNAEIDTILAA